MRDQIVSDFLNTLARPAIPAPAGATVAALALAQAAALLSRAAGGDAEADHLTRHALRLAEIDAHAVTHDVPDRAQPAADVVAVAVEVVRVAERLLSTVDPTALPDVSAAAEMARSSAMTARVAVEARHGVLFAAEPDEIAERAARVTEAVRVREGLLEGI
ncbi:MULTISPECIES: hypothetical protein, partial [unclassified Amycolatopsis]|uniref:hypothetical protein n=1 Tax=unclassified Amycolatopsis TaxID=2618356 RepID=UPI00106E007B